MIQETPPNYMRTAVDIAVWRALLAAMNQVRAEAADLLSHGPIRPGSLFDPGGSTAIDERIRTELIPRALAEQQRRLPPGAAFPPFAPDVLFSAIRGYAELDPLIIDPHVSEIIVDGPGQEVYVEREGVLHGTGLSLSRERILYLIERIAAPLGQSLNETHPVVEVQRDRARVTAVHERLAPRGPSLVIRLQARTRLSQDDLIVGGTISQAMWDALAAAFRGGANMIIAGETSSGKTTLLGALLAALPPEQRIVTIEDPIEIDLGRPRVEQLEVRPRNGDMPGYDQRALLRLSLRLRPDRLIVGEVRDGAAWDMVDAMSLGQHGSIATIHAGTISQALLRLESLCLRADDVPPLLAVRRTIGEVLNLAVQMRRMPVYEGGRQVLKRLVVGISEVIGLNEDSQPGLPYQLQPLAVLQGGILTPTGTRLSSSLAARLEDAGEQDLFA